MNGKEFLPHAVIGGAPRSGTTFACEILAKHPGIHVARPFIPEPKVLMTAHPDGDDGYRTRYESLFAEAPEGAVRVEKTSYYLENSEARERFARILPNSRMIFILRDPVDRAFSNWRWSSMNGLETMPFAEAIACEGARDNPLPAERAYARPYDYLTRANYGSFAEAWIGAIGRERLAFFQFETAMARPGDFASELQTFLGVDALPWSTLMTERVNPSDGAGDGVDPALARRIRESVRPEIERLADLTGLDVTVWGY